jgi:enoyl-CoA hydratase/carnithine racemase
MNLTDPTPPPVLRHDRDGVVILELSRPQSRNAFSPELREMLAAHLAELADAPVKGIVITGAGGHFSAGGDVKTFAVATADDVVGWLRTAHRCVSAIAAAPYPVVAAVSGNCAGGAVGLALACDAIVAEPDAVFHLPFLRLGLVPDWGATFLLRRKIGDGAASRLMLRPSSTDAARALQLGIVDEPADAGQGLERAVALVNEMASWPRAAWAATKRSLRRDDASLEDALAFELATQGRCADSPEFIERARAFANRPKNR